MAGTVPTGSLFLRHWQDGSTFQVVGGARYHLEPWEYTGLGSPAYINVPIGFIDTLGSVPSEGTHLRDPADGAIYRIIGGAKHHLTSEEWDALNEQAQSYTNVPTGFLATIADAPDA